MRERSGVRHGEQSKKPNFFKEYKRPSKILTIILAFAIGRGKYKNKIEIPFVMELVLKEKRGIYCPAKKAGIYNHE